MVSNTATTGASYELMLTSGAEALAGEHANDLWRKTVTVVHSIPQKALTLVQRKTANAWLKFAVENPRDTDGWWSMPVAQLCKEAGFPSRNREPLKIAAKALMGVIFEFDVLAPESKRAVWRGHVLFPSVEISDGYVRWMVNDAIYREACRPEVYALIDMAIMRKFSTNAALQIWEFCVRFQNIGVTARMTWERFRDYVLGNSEKTSFSEYKILKRRVIAPAIEEINERSEHEIELLEYKSGRRIAEIQFKVRSKRNSIDIPQEAGVLVERMVRLGVPGSEARRLAMQYDVNRLSGAIRYTEMRQTDAAQPPLNVPAAYFRKALEQGYGESAINTSNKQDSPAKTAGQDKTFDIYEAYGQHRRDLAKQYVESLNDAERKELREQYNEQQEHDKLRVKSRPTKIAEIAFLNWVSLNTWGEPSDKDILQFSVSLLAKQGGG